MKKITSLTFVIIAVAMTLSGCLSSEKKAEKKVKKLQEAGDSAVMAAYVQDPEASSALEEAAVSAAHNISSRLIYQRDTQLTIVPLVCRTLEKKSGREEMMKYFIANAVTEGWANYVYHAFFPRDSMTHRVAKELKNLSWILCSMNATQAADWIAKNIDEDLQWHMQNNITDSTKVKIAALLPDSAIIPLRLHRHVSVSRRISILQKMSLQEAVNFTTSSEEIRTLTQYRWITLSVAEMLTAWHSIKSGKMTKALIKRLKTKSTTELIVAYDHGREGEDNSLFSKFAPIVIQSVKSDLDYVQATNFFTHYGSPGWVALLQKKTLQEELKVELKFDLN